MGAKIEPVPGWARARVLKGDLFSLIEHGHFDGDPSRLTLRDTRYARWFLRPTAWLLANTEARALRRVGDGRQIPRLRRWRGGVLVRDWLAGRPLDQGTPSNPGYYRSAFTLLARLHRRGIAHNDLAKATNWLVLEDGTAGLIDFQIASLHRWRTPRFRWLAREDLRHLLKHKRRFAPERMTERQWRMVNSRSWPHRLNLLLWKPVYHLITRRLLGWRDREGQTDRNFLRERGERRDDALPGGARRLITPASQTIGTTMAIERTFSIIKPDATRRNFTGAINQRLEKAGLRIVAQKRIQLTRAQAEAFYGVHKARPFFNDLCNFMISGPIVVQVLEGENAIAKNREVMGATNPANAAPGTIRKDFAESIEANSVHGSDGPDTAKAEIAYFFSGLELVG